MITYVTVTFMQSCDTKKDVKDSRTDYSIATICWPYEKYIYFRVG